MSYPPQGEVTKADLIAHTALATGVHGVGVGSVVGTTLSQELTNKILNASVAKGTWTASGIWTLPALTLGGTLTLNSQILDAGSGYAQINTTSTQLLRLEATSTGASGVGITCLHDSSSPAVDDVVAYFNFQGRDSAANIETYGSLYCKIVNKTVGSEEAKYEFRLRDSGAENLAFYLTGAGEGFFDLAGSGDALPTVFDEYDDAKQLQLASQGQIDVLIKMGVAQKVEGHKGYMLSQNKFNWVLAGGIYQTRQMLEDGFKELNTRLTKLELALPLGG